MTSKKTFNQVFSFLLQNSCYTDCTFFAVKMEEHFVILVFREIIHLCLDQKTPANSNHCFPEQRPRNEFISKSVSSKKVCFYWTITFIVLVGGKLSHLKSEKFERLKCVVNMICLLQTREITYLA